VTTTLVVLLVTWLLAALVSFTFGYLGAKAFHRRNTKSKWKGPS
jgi:hypothetical protein